MTPFSLALPTRILFGRGQAAQAADLIRAFGPRGIIVHGASPSRANALIAALGQPLTIACPREPDLPMLEAALATARAARPDWVAAIGGGAALDLGKALAGLIPQPGVPMDHLEVVGRGLPLGAAPLPFVAIPTTAGTGAEATKNAVIGVPDHGRKVSLRDDRMLARLAIVDPALTDGCPWPVTLTSGLDAVTQVIEPFISARANPVTDALCRPAIARGLAALTGLRAIEHPGLRDDLALTSLTGGIALANAGLGAVHGLAGVIGGLTGAAHGAICGALLAPVLQVNAAALPDDPRIVDLRGLIAPVFDAHPDQAFEALADWVRGAGLPGLRAQGLDPADHAAVAEAALASSSMKGNPAPLGTGPLIAAMVAAG
ncbi:iron-containing alcohol dehydrogenase [Paracoccus sp. p4-l81]|uniref:iron-containing alcohol dehydrogenase n=1 Tax=Paracoccus sp. p4-l81 TaxID=3342806 RepID=UPI0035B92BFE